jgi:hypothetical protein
LSAYFLAGFALFRVLDEGKLSLSPDELFGNFSSVDGAKKMYISFAIVHLIHF